MTDAPGSEVAALQAELAAMRTHAAGLEARVAALIDGQQDLTHLILDNSPFGISLFDPDLRYQYVNPRHQQLTRRQVKDLLGRSLADAFPQAWESVAAIFERAQATGEVQRLPGQHLRMERDGLPVDSYWDLHIIPLRDADGSHRGFLSLSHEVTDRVNAEAHKDQFLGVLSHELRTPINAIMGFGSILEDGLAGDLNPKQAEFVGRILTSTDRMLALVDDLLDMSRIQAGKFWLAPQALDLAGACDQAAAEHAALAAERGQTIRVELPAGLPPCLADPPRLGQILGNLVSNAVRYAPRGSTITLRAGAEPTQVRVEVHDEGEGLTPEDHAHIFRPFTQLDMTPTRAQGGLGLGLSIVKALVEAHGGDLGLDTTPGAGTVFWFTLPVMLDS